MCVTSARNASFLLSIPHSAVPPSHPKKQTPVSSGKEGKPANCLKSAFISPGDEQSDARPVNKG